DRGRCFAGWSPPPGRSSPTVPRELLGLTQRQTGSSSERALGCSVRWRLGGTLAHRARRSTTPAEKPQRRQRCRPIASLLAGAGVDVLTLSSSGNTDNTTDNVPKAQT